MLSFATFNVKITHFCFSTDTGLPISVLRLLVPPVRLVAAAIWKTIEQRVVAQYGLIEEFISLVTDIVPEILTIDQRVQLTLGLRARVRRILIYDLISEVGATNIETPHLEFVELVKKMLNNSDHRQQFFQVNFPEDFGPTYDKALLILIWTFLSRLEKLLTLKTFQEVASSVLEECVQSQSQEQLKLLLHYQKDHSHLDHNGKSQGLEKILLEEGRSLSSELLVTDELSCQKMKSSDRPQVKDTHVPPVIVEDDQAHPKNVGKSPQCAPTRSIRNSKRQISLCLKSRSGKHGKSNASESRACTNKKAYTQCLICKEDVKTSLKSHLKTHFPTSDYACPRCDSRFKLYSSLKLHLNRTCFDADESKKLYKCDKCKECFRYKVALERHNLTHNVLYCGVCRKVLRDAATLVRHKASHTPFQCNRCEESFTLFKPLLRHCQNIHKITRPFKCIHCSKTSSNLRILIAHEWKHTGHLPFQCAHCGLRCKTDADLISHERVHTREKPYLCAECGKTFSRNSNLLRHLNFLHGESRNQKFSCSECEKFFKEKGALKKHQRSKHLKELPFKCNMPECDKVFRSNSEVKRHVLLHHSTERPYKCDVCGKGFIKICFLNAHAKIHSGEKPFICHICGKAFPKLYSMERHKKLIHPFIE
uniref:C2H2-type domain-containing protein n=1 Tax=Takifugu rubripes TaxID=31033 RepID=H2SQL3_TAKRU